MMDSRPRGHLFDYDSCERVEAVVVHVASWICRRRTVWRSRPCGRALRRRDVGTAACADCTNRGAHSRSTGQPEVKQEAVQVVNSHAPSDWRDVR